MTLGSLPPPHPDHTTPWDHELHVTQSEPIAPHHPVTLTLLDHHVTHDPTSSPHVDVEPAVCRQKASPPRGGAAPQLTQGSHGAAAVRLSLESWELAKGARRRT